MAIAKRAPLPLWTSENLLTFVTALAKPERSVLDWRIMALQLLCYVTMQRFNDLQGIKVEDIRVLVNGDLRIFQKVAKTFSDGSGELAECNRKLVFVIVFFIIGHNRNQAQDTLGRSGKTGFSGTDKKPHFLRKCKQGTSSSVERMADGEKEAQGVHSA